ncbi:MAG TPA: hypothetical protein VKF14_06460 [Candidatus Dormibacteraeota bacterium]|nr:hypothetical protein [Candidatus Dormibacteraeota bacterium]
MHPYPEQRSPPPTPASNLRLYRDPFPKFLFNFGWETPINR